MIDTSFKIKRQVSGRNYYGLIELEIELNSIRKVEISYSSEEADSEWHSIIEAGIHHFFYHYYLDEQKGLSINIKKLHTMLGDTTPAIVFYITVLCLEIALNYKKGLIKLDENDGTFLLVR